MIPKCGESIAATEKNLQKKKKKQIQRTGSDIIVGVLVFPIFRINFDSIENNYRRAYPYFYDVKREIYECRARSILPVRFKSPSIELIKCYRRVILLNREIERVSVHQTPPFAPDAMLYGKFSYLRRAWPRIYRRKCAPGWMPININVRPQHDPASPFVSEHRVTVFTRSPTPLPCPLFATIRFIREFTQFRF